MRLGPEVTIGEAADQLGAVVLDLKRLLEQPGGLLPQEYLAWVEDCENGLWGVFDEPDVMAWLYTDRYWRIYADLTATAVDLLMIDTSLPVPDACTQEASMLLAYLTDLADQLAQLRTWVHRPGRVLVYDTNSLMHFQPPGMIDWAALVEAPQVRLVVPLVVIDELDRKKYAGSEKMARRAAGALRALDQLLEGAGPGAAVGVPGRAGVSVEVLLDEDGHRRMTGADDEIIDRAVLIGQLTGEPVTVVTADTGMRLRAQSAGVGALRLPDQYGKDQSQP